MERESRGRTVTTRASKEELKAMERQAKEALKAIVIPPYTPPTPEEIVRRVELGRRMDAFAEALGPVDPSIIQDRREGLAGEAEDDG